MTADLSPLRLLLVTLAGWVNRHQQQVIEYLMEENRVLREQLNQQRTTTGYVARPIDHCGPRQPPPAIGQ